MHPSTCSICLDTVSHSGGDQYILECGHVFHETCISHWKEGTCPNCRAVFNYDDADSNIRVEQFQIDNERRMSHINVLDAGDENMTFCDNLHQSCVRQFYIRRGCMGYLLSVFVCIILSVGLIYVITAAVNQNCRTYYRSRACGKLNTCMNLNRTYLEYCLQA